LFLNAVAVSCSILNIAPPVLEAANYQRMPWNGLAAFENPPVPFPLPSPSFFHYRCRANLKIVAGQNLRIGFTGAAPSIFRERMPAACS